MNIRMLFILLTAAILFGISAGCTKDEPVTGNYKTENTGQTEDSKSETSENTDENGQNQNKEMKNIEIKIRNGRSFVAELQDNSSARALAELLEQGDIVVNMNDYANMEKVGQLGVSLPRNDEYITTSPGDLILYQGNQFVIYYDTNRWSLTRLGRILDVTQQELKQALGTGSVTVTLSIKRETSSIR